MCTLLWGYSFQFDNFTFLYNDDCCKEKIGLPCVVCFTKLLKKIVTLTFRKFCINNVMLLVLQDMFEEKRSILEPAGALALAGAEAYCRYYGIKEVNVVAIASGANMNFDKLRVVTELANVGRQQEAVLTTVLPEKPGSFKQFCKLVLAYDLNNFSYQTFLMFMLST